MSEKNEKKINQTEGFFPIGTVANILGVHIRTLRIYDEQGLLMPARSEYNRRLYCEKDIERARFILFLTRNLAVNLSGVKIILKLMEANKIKPNLYMDYIKNLAKTLNISEVEQEINKEVMTKRCKGLSKFSTL